MRRPILAATVALTLAVPRPAHALFGEEDWLSGQNQLLAALLAQDMEQTANLVGLFANARMLLTSVNESLALTRTAYRQVQAIRNYTLQDLADDARAGLYQAYPDLEDIERESRALVANGEAIEDGTFWSHTDHHDRDVSRRAHAAFDFAYQSTIWPIAFTNAMRHAPHPSPVDLEIQNLYRRTGQRYQIAVQQMAFTVLARRVGLLLGEAEERDHLPTRIAATNAALSYQTMRNSTELLELEKARAAHEEHSRLEDRIQRRRARSDLSGIAPALWTPAAVPPASEEK